MTHGGKHMAIKFGSPEALRILERERKLRQLEQQGQDPDRVIAELRAKIKECQKSIADQLVEIETIRDSIDRQKGIKIVLHDRLEELTGNRF